LKKALLIYSKLKGMTIDIDIADNKNEAIKVVKSLVFINIKWMIHIHFISF